ncbi:TPA: hypothetical protein DIV49_01265 [Candidatus Saccharibacteria bacterium]|nr:hypothetical protein [Candidatus Saccharibacteria bacterium]HRJ90978.1 NUDIX domain-containing protein [Candidatus Saccharibacteria bacterium]
MEIAYCRRCGAPAKFQGGIQYVCSNGHPIYANPLPTASIFLVRDSQVLLAVRAIEPGKGKLDSIGGFVDGNETFEEAAYRELKEEAGLEPSQIGPLHYLTSSIGEYLFKDEPLQVLSLFYVASFDANTVPTPHDDAASFTWREATSLSLDEFHANDVRSGIVALQSYLTDK